MKNSYVQTQAPNNIEVTFYKSSGRDAVRLVSDTIVREECLQHGRLVGMYWSASGQVQRESGSDALPRADSSELPIHVFDLEIDGQSLHNRWDWVSGYQRSGKRSGTIEAVVELRHQVRPVSVKVVTRVDGSPVLARWLEVTNTGSSPAALSNVSPWRGLLWNTEPTDWALPVLDPLRHPEFTLGYLPSDHWGAEGDFMWRKLDAENFRIERRQARAHGSPYFVVRNETTGEFVFIGLAWSGNWHADFTHHPQPHLFFDIGPMGPAPLRVVAPGETVVSPEVHLGMMHCNMDAAVQLWHRHVRASVLSPRPEGKEMFVVAGRVVEHMDEWILREIDIAAEMGVEAFMVDAGWYGDEFHEWAHNRGDWYEGSWLPGGMAGVRDYAHDKGLHFGLWIEAETVSDQSKLFKEHPDWLLKTDDDRILGGYALNLGKPEAAKYMEDSVTRVIGDFCLDFYKLDYNISTNEGGQNMVDGYAEHEAWRHYESVYGLYDRIRSEFPNVALENCAGGGGRNDLGMLSRFHYVCESDWSVHPFAIRAINAMTLFLPPEAMCYYHNHMPNAHQLADLDTHLRVTLFAQTTFVGFGGQSADRSTEYFAKTRRYIELAKTFCRPIMANHPRVYHHTPDIGVVGPADWCALEYASQDRTMGYAGVFKISSGNNSEYVFRPRGLDCSRDYDVILDNCNCTLRISGWELVERGITVRLDAANTSELIMFSASNKCLSR